MLLLISYDVASAKDRPANYEQIRQCINDHSIEARRALYSQWLVVTDDGPATWMEWFRPVLTPEDRMLITRVSGPVNGWLPSEFWEWINVHA